MADYTLAPSPYQTVFDNAGAPVSNACVWTYAAGTTTPIATYSDNLGTPNTNPIRTDPAGRYTAYLLPGVGYKFVVEGPATPPAHGVVLRTQDNIVGTPAAPAVTSGTWIPSLGGTATYTAREGTWARVGAIVMARGTLTVNTIGTGSTSIISGLPYPVAGDTPGAIGNFSAAAASLVSLTGWALSGGQNLGVIGLPVAGALNQYLTFFGNGTSVNFSITYLTTAP